MTVAHGTKIRPHVRWWVQWVPSLCPRTSNSKGHKHTAQTLVTAETLRLWETTQEVHQQDHNKPSSVLSPIHVAVTSHRRSRQWVLHRHHACTTDPGEKLLTRPLLPLAASMLRRLTTVFVLLSKIVCLCSYSGSWCPSTTHRALAARLRL